jgi:hypothetical protein
MSNGVKLCPKCGELLIYASPVLIIPAMVQPGVADPVNTKAGLPVEAWVCSGASGCAYVELYHVKIKK